MPTTNLGVCPAPPSWIKYVCRAYSEEPNPDQRKRSFIAVSLSFFRHVARLHSFVSCNKNRGFHFDFLLRETFPLGALFDCFFEVELGSQWDLLPSPGSHQNRLVTTEQIVLHNIILCVIFEHRHNGRPLHAIGR